MATPQTDLGYFVLISWVASVWATKTLEFAPNADGVGWCPNRSNYRKGDIGINIVDRGNNAVRFQSRADEKAEFDVSVTDFGVVLTDDLDAYQIDPTSVADQEVKLNLGFGLNESLGEEQNLLHGYEVIGAHTDEKINNVMRDIFKKNGYEDNVAMEFDIIAMRDKMQQRVNPN